MAPPQWVVLHRSPLVLPQGAGISLALAAPPHISQVQVPPSLVVSGSAVLAADPAGILLLSACRGTDPHAADEPASASYDLWDAVSNTSSHVPAPEPETTTLNDDDTAGVAAGGLLVVRKFGKHRVMVAELSVRDSAATLRCFSTETRRWTHKNLRSPPMKQRRQWCSAYALSYRGRLWWVDLSLGLLACDPFADNPELHWVPLPSFLQVGDHCVSLSCGKLRLVVINNKNRRRTRRQPSIKLWTLADYEAGKWSLDFDIPMEHIGGLPKDKERPMRLAFVHPSNAHVVYFSLEQQLFAVDLQTNKVTESASMGRGDYSGGDHLLAWELPQSLRVPLPAGPSPTQESSRFRSAGFDSVADSFCAAYGGALADMESYKLSSMALAYLNRKKKPEDKQFKVSERLFLQTFVEDTNIKIKKYAHLNFYADTGSKKVLVFADFHTDAVDDEDRDKWALSSCKTLTGNSIGGLYGEDVDNRRRMESKKRKRSIFCFACAAEMLHPISGFEGGYAGISAM